MAEPVNPRAATMDGGRSNYSGSLSFLLENCPSLLELECMAEEENQLDSGGNRTEQGNRSYLDGVGKGGEQHQHQQQEETKKFHLLKVITEMHAWENREKKLRRQTK